MSKRTQHKAKQGRPEPTESWISPRGGLAVISLVSIALGLWVGWKAVQASGLIEGIAWGLAFGASIWVIFLGTYLLNRWFRRR